MPDSKILDNEEGKKTTCNKERVFSVDLKSRSAIKTVSLGNGWRDGVLIEGALGTLQSVGFLEGMILELIGTNGVLRVDLTREELLTNPPQDARKMELK
jgi:hypothetical protein